MWFFPGNVSILDMFKVGQAKLWYSGGQGYQDIFSLCECNTTGSQGASGTVQHGGKGIAEQLHSWRKDSRREG